MENEISNIFDIRSHTFDVSDQAVFILKDSGLCDEERNKTNVSNHLTEIQSRSSCFLFVMMTVHWDQADPNCNYNRMIYRAWIQIPFNVDGIYFSIYTHMLENPHIIIVHLAALDNGRKPDIGTLKKDRGDIFLEFCAERFKAKFLQ